MVVYNVPEVIAVTDEGREDELDREIAKEYEGLSLEQLWEKLREARRVAGYKPKQREIGEDGALLLDPNDPNDREWYENDDDYQY